MKQVCAPPALCHHLLLRVLVRGVADRLLQVLDALHQPGSRKSGMLSCLGFAFLNVTSAFGMGCYR